MAHRREAAVYDAPVVGAEQSFVVGGRRVNQPGVDRHAGVVDPPIDAAELLDGVKGGGLDLPQVADVGYREGDAPAFRLDPRCDPSQHRFVAGYEYHAGAAPRGQASSRKADARGGAGDHDDLF